jgi:hypothetical protein
VGGAKRKAVIALIFSLVNVLLLTAAVCFSVILYPDSLATRPFAFLAFLAFRFSGECSVAQLQYVFLLFSIPILWLDVLSLFAFLAFRFSL